MREFNVGDKIRIKKNLKEGNNYKVFVAQSMVNWAGKIVTISEKTFNGDYKIKEDANSWTWSEDMFDGLVQVTREELLKMEIGTKIVTNRDEDNEFVFDGNGYFVSKKSFMSDYDINDDLTLDNKDNGTRIIKIQKPTYETIYNYSTEVKEMTIEEIEKELGYSIKIVKEEKENEF